MTEPQPVMDQAEQDQLTRQVGRALLTVAGADWKQVRAEYRSAGRHIEVDVFVTGPDGAPRMVRPPVEVVDGLGRLRQGMYRPGRGTWISAEYLLEPPSSFSAEFEPDVEPRWRRVPPPIGFADELRFFPRADEHIPDWLRQRAGLPPATGEQPPTPPGGQAVGTPTPDVGTPTPDVGTPTPGADTPTSGADTPGQPAGQPTPPGGAVRPGQPVPAHAGQPTPPGGSPQPGAQQAGQPTPPGGEPRPGFPGPGQQAPGQQRPAFQPGPQQPGTPPSGGPVPFQQPGGAPNQPSTPPGGPPSQPAW
ncbi:MAG: hypothetical protein GEV28_39615 [Actinophytocola sp.]|uniref:hypothetical protein n=1 Tax=Actinophytocola sp. TaxID=1872138 RepID=UPI001325E2B4|nr:hypothetical protein [Actinophytocola sp.]MPZ86158.1 hypothetical protein [Actinophytocola sp.]